MCDTFAMKRGGATWFAKNSDREQDERQIVERHDAVKGDRAKTLRCTYIEIEQVPDRRAVLLSRPGWMWGAEMGVNDAGVAVGNEAVFSKSILKKGEALLGMDLARLALERASTASEAIDVIISLLTRHGQGGPAGCRDKNFRYDNSFLIADANGVFVLETAGRNWAMKHADDGWSISNAYTLRADYDRASMAGVDFKAMHETFAMPRLACASARRSSTYEFALQAEPPSSLADLADQLRRHASGDGFAGGSNRDVCMHASGPLRPHASTGSMIVRLAPGLSSTAYFTGTPQPCISLFRPARFDVPLGAVFPNDLFERGRAAQARARADEGFRRAIRASIQGAQAAVFSAMTGDMTVEAENIACSWTDEWLPSAA